MTHQRILTPSRSHALARAPGLRTRLADWFRGHGDIPGPDTDLQDDGDGMTEVLEPIPAPPWYGASVTAGNPLPALARAYVPAPPAEVLPPVPLTQPAVIFEAIGGEERTARDCTWCGALSGRGDFSWRYDALGHWSCPSCQMRPDWHAPSLPGIPSATRYDEDNGMYEMGIIARSLLATDPRAVRQRPDGQWVAAIPIEGRRKVLGSFGSKAEAEFVYGAVLGAFAEAAVRRAA